jgi:flagellar assembly protein FliH
VTSAPPSGPSPSHLPSSREILLPSRKPTPEEERQRQQERELLTQILSTLRTTASECRRQYQEHLQQWQQAAIELAVTIAARLLYERLEAGKFPIDIRVREMIAQLDNEPVLTVRLHPQDLKLLRDRVGEQALVGEQQQIRLLADPTLARGECRVEGRETLLLSDVVQQLEQIREELLRSLGYARS